MYWLKYYSWASDTTLLTALQIFVMSRYMSVLQNRYQQNRETCSCMKLGQGYLSKYDVFLMCSIWVF